jgi:predicted alpha/beta-fold hydrolase
MPELRSTFSPAWWLPGPHLPTAWGKFGRRRPPVHDRTERVITPDGDHITLARMGQIRGGVPHLLVLHGLEGKLTAKYAHGLLDQAKRLGWTGDLMMFRTCDGEMNSARRLYHSGETSDVDFIIRKKLLREDPDLRLMIVGVSLGGNVLLKWLGEQGSSVPQQVERAAGVSVPFDLEAGSIFMEKGISPAYTSHFLKTLSAKTVAKLQQYPDLCNIDELRACRTFRDFDDLVTGPVHGFADSHDYYTQCSSIRFIEHIEVPTFLISSWNDPFLPAETLERVRSIVSTKPNLHLELTATGGHVGWIEGTPWSQRYYMEERVVNWMNNSV